MIYNFSPIDLLPYILLFGLLLIIASLKRDERSKARLMFWCLFVFTAIRYGIGYDFFGYKSAIENPRRGYDGIDRWELFPYLLGLLSRKTFFQLFVIVTSFLTLYPVYRISVKLSISPSFSVLVYTLHPVLFLDGMGIMRNAVAFSIMMLVFYHLRRKELLKALVFWICACLFHQAALVGCLLFFLYYRPPSKIVSLALFIVSFLVSSMVPQVISRLAESVPLFQAAEHYIENKAVSNGGKLQYINDAICLFNFVFWDRLVAVHKNNKYYLAFYNVGICLWNLFLPFDSTLAMRLSTFFLIYIILLAPSYKLIWKKKYCKLAGQLSTLFFVAFLLSSFYIVTATSAPGQHLSYLPYQTVFYHIDYLNYIGG